MRTVVFRGQCRPDSKYAGEWVEGSLVKCENGDALIVSAFRKNCISSYMVVPETVGQFTGVYDKNGKPIFEGDVVCQHDNTYKLDYIGKVIYNDDEAMFEIDVEKYCKIRFCKSSVENNGHETIEHVFEYEIIKR